MRGWLLCRKHFLGFLGVLRDFSSSDWGSFGCPNSSAVWQLSPVPCVYRSTYLHLEQRCYQILSALGGYLGPARARRSDSGSFRSKILDQRYYWSSWLSQILSTLKLSYFHRIHGQVLAYRSLLEACILARKIPSSNLRLRQKWHFPDFSSGCCSRIDLCRFSECRERAQRKLSSAG